MPISLLADLARLAKQTLGAQRKYFKTKLRQHLLEAKDYEQRLDRAAEDAICLYNATPDLFEVPSTSRLPD